VPRYRRRGPASGRHESARLELDVFASLKTWGWVVLIPGVLQALAGVGVLAANHRTFQARMVLSP
jgi:hypothetical protein